MTRLGHTISACLAGLLISAGAAGAAAPGAPLPATLLNTDALARTQPAQAVTELNRYAGDPEAAALPVRRALLLRLRRNYLDLGDYPAARDVSARLLKLGEQHHDPISIAWANISGIEENLRIFHTDAAKTALENIGKQVKLAAMPDMAYAVHIGYGRLYLLKADYEHAIEQFQAGVALAPETQDPSSARTDALRNLAYCYLALNDPMSAHAIIGKALESDPDAVRAHIRSLAHLAQALVLMELKRYNEAEAAFSRSLAIARSSGLRAIESRVLGDWAELALQRENYTAAERLSRQALQVADRIGDAGVGIIARANLGFALGGQGKMVEGLRDIDAVVAHFREQGNNQALLSMLDEKGHLLERQGWFKEAVAVLREQQKLERTQFTEQRGKAVAALEGRFELDQNRHRIELLQKQSTLKDVEIRNRELRLLALGLAVLLTLAVGALLGLLYRRARKSNAQLQVLNTRLAEHAVRDTLTGLYNRRSFADMMFARSGRIEGNRRGGDAQYPSDSFMLLDLDHFKAVNDTYGHAAGDSVLVELARRLLAVVRDSDTVLRWGGEEFVIYLPNCGEAQAAALAQRILDAVGGTPFEVGATTLQITISMGLVEMPFASLSELECDWQRALQLADAALYLAKGDGRNRCQQLLPAAVPLPISLDQLEQDLGGAAVAGHVVLHTILPSAASGNSAAPIPS